MSRPGIVTAVGGDVSHVKEGDHVMVTWVQRNATRATAATDAGQSHIQGPAVYYGAPALRARSPGRGDTVADQQMVVPLDKASPPTHLDHRLRGHDWRGRGIERGAGAAWQTRW